MAFSYGSWAQPQGYNADLGQLGASIGNIIKEKQAEAALGDYVKSLYMQGGQQGQSADPIAKLVNSSHATAQGAQDPTLNSYFSAIRAAESGGDDAAKNPKSSATGRYQFIDSTWQGLMLAHPELGLTPDGRTDPAQQEKAIRALTSDNIKSLKSNGVGINPGNLYAAHFLGAEGASSVLGQGDDTPMSQAVAPEVIQANPQLANMTVGQFKQWAAQKGGNSSGGYAAPTDQSSAASGNVAQSGGLPPQELLTRLIQNPKTREFAGKLIEGTEGKGGIEQDANTRFRLGREQGLTGEALKQFTLTGKLPDEAKDQALVNTGGGLIYDPNTKSWITPPEGAAGTGSADFDDISGIRKEVQSLPSYKNMAQALPIYRSMAETAGRNSKASDLNLVYGLGKIMDPTSVVREGEMVMVKNAASLPDWLVGSINSLNGGAALTPDTRNAILTEAYGRMKGYQDAFSQDVQQYQGIADRYKINEADVLPNFGEVAPYEPGTGDAEIDDLLKKYQ